MTLIKLFLLLGLSPNFLPTVSKPNNFLINFFTSLIFPFPLFFLPGECQKVNDQRRDIGQVRAAEREDSAWLGKEALWKGIFRQTGGVTRCSGMQLDVCKDFPSCEFLVADTRLYTLPFRSVGRSVTFLSGLWEFFALLPLPHFPPLSCRVSGLVNRELATQKEALFVRRSVPPWGKLAIKMLRIW